MIRILSEGVIYTAILLSCFDGDTCKIRLDNAYPPFVEDQTIRFEGFDTPEIHGACAQEKEMAIRARAITLDFMRSGNALLEYKGKGGFQRSLMAAPELRDKLFAEDLARPYVKDKRARKGWCDD